MLFRPIVVDKVSSWLRYFPSDPNAIWELGTGIYAKIFADVLRVSSEVKTCLCYDMMCAAKINMLTSCC